MYWFELTSCSRISSFGQGQPLAACQCEGSVPLIGQSSGIRVIKIIVEVVVEVGVHDSTLINLWMSSADIERVL